jgi:hypothetical protein
MHSKIQYKNLTIFLIIKSYLLCGLCALSILLEY